VKRGLRVTLLVLSLGLMGAPSADAYIWWQSYDSANSKIGRVGNDGAGGGGLGFVSGSYFGGGIGSNGVHAYWGESGSFPDLGDIGRVGVSGTGSDATHSWMSSGTFCGTFDAAANATTVYWLVSTCSGTNRQISGATVAGSDLGMVVNTPGSCGFGIDGTYIYWSNGQYIARALLNGSNPDADWLDTGTGVTPCDVAADATHVYWTFDGSNRTALGRAAINGTGVNNSWASVLAYSGDASLPTPIAVDGTYVYWGWRPAAGGPGSIGRVTKSGGTGDSTFITGAGYPDGLAVDAVAPGADADGDGVPDSTDNCVNAANTDQVDSDGDGQGNVCDPDDDNDGAADGSDNCPTIANAGQADVDSDGLGDPCDPDDDNDGVADASDNCRLVANPDQRDDDKDGVGRACDANDTPPPPPPMRIVVVVSSNPSFAPGSGSTPIRGNTAQRRRVPRGTVFSFRLNQEARVTIDILRKKAGRMVKRKCRKPTAKTRTKRKCDLRVAPRLFRSAHAGENRVPFTGRIKRKALKPGRYVAVFTATGAGGKSKARAPFRIVRP
jgi:hypothetical protein